MERGSQNGACVRAIKVMIPWLILGGVAGGFGRSYPVFRFIGFALFVGTICLGVREIIRANFELTCPACHWILGGRKRGKRTIRQVLFGGWTCPNCGCDVDHFGSKRR